MKKILLLLFLLLSSLIFANDPIIIIEGIPSRRAEPILEAKEQPTTTITTKEITPPTEEVVEQVATISEKIEPELVFTATPKKSFTYEKMNCTFEVPVSWNLDTSSENFRVMAYPYNGDPVLVTMRTYRASEKITANTVYLYRSGSVWDRWHLLGSRVFNPKESFLIGVDEKISGVYRKQEMTERLALETTIVAEDIYVKAPDLVYIVTAQAPEDIWRKHNQTVREIMNSFYVEDRDGKKL